MCTWLAVMHPPHLYTTSRCHWHSPHSLTAHTAVSKPGGMSPRWAGPGRANCDARSVAILMNPSRRDGRTRSLGHKRNFSAPTGHPAAAAAAGPSRTESGSVAPGRATVVINLTASRRRVGPPQAGDCVSVWWFLFVLGVYHNGGWRGAVAGCGHR